MATAPDTSKLGPVYLMPGISKTNALVFLYAAFIGITLNTFVNFIQPYVLIEQLNVPKEIQGRMTGDLVFYAEIMLLFACGVVGIAADRYSRRMIFAIGFLILSLGFLVYGFVDNFSALLLLRLFFATGIACINVLVSTVLADYPQERSRGKLVGLSAFCIGLGALVLAFGLARLPNFFAATNDALWAGRLTLLTVSAIALVSAIIVGTGLAGPETARVSEDKVGWRESLRIAIGAARKNPKIGVAYASAFVARSDLIVIGVFFSLWFMQIGVAQGMSTDEASKTAGMFFGIVQLCGLLWAPIGGVINDRLDRLTAVIVSLGIAAIGYGSVAFIKNPLGPEMYLCAFLLGIGQISIMLASQTLIGQEAPEASRGSVMGAFSICGALGIMFITKVGGWAFDMWNPAPFVIVAVANVLLLFAAVVVSRKCARPAQSSTGPQEA